MDKEILAYYSANKDWLFSLTRLNSPFIRAIARAVIESAKHKIESEHRGYNGKQ